MLAFVSGYLLGERTTKAQSVNPESGWKRAFTVHPESFVRVQCELVDDTIIDGWLFLFSPDFEESDDRSLILSAPVHIRRAKDLETSPLETGTIVIAAGQIRFLSVGYFDETG